MQPKDRNEEFPVTPRSLELPLARHVAEPLRLPE